MTSKTYHVGENGQVRTQDDFTGPWVDCPIIASFPSYTGNLYDVETDPNDLNKAWVVGDKQLGGTTGLFVTNDAGLTWAAPPGAYHAGITRFWEVCVIDSLNIVAVGEQGRVAVSTNGVTFSALANCPTPTGTLAPGNAYAVHFTSATQGVVSFYTSTNEYFIYKTVDGGTTWATLNGGVDLQVTFGSPLIGTPNAIYMSDDGMIIVAHSERGILRSVDGGNTFMQVHTYNYREGQHMTWQPRHNATTLWGTGRGNSRITSTDAGATWIVQSLTTLPITGNPEVRASHYHTFSNGFFSGDANLYISGNSGLTGSLTDSSSENINAVWTNIIPCWILTDCSGEQADIITDTDLSLFEDKIIKIAGSTACWTVEISQTCVGSTPVTVASIAYDDCEACVGTCYNLIDCQGQVSDVVVTNDLEDFIGQTISYNNRCWTVQVSTTCTGGILIPQPDTSFNTCFECLPKCYLLTDCSNSSSTHTFSDDLSDYVGKVIQFKGSLSCWSVEEVTDCTCPEQMPGPVMSVFQTCSNCPAPYTPSPSDPFVKPGFDLMNCDEDEYLDIKCAFANAIFNEMVKKRYGVNTCCDEDIDSLWIKNERVDLIEMYDPTACIAQPEHCCAPCNVEADLTIFIPITCPAPEDVTAELILPDPPLCPEPDNVSADLIIE
jgi:hypothetical protein